MLIEYICVVCSVHELLCPAYITSWLWHWCETTNLLHLSISTFVICTMYFWAVREEFFYSLTNVEVQYLQCNALAALLNGSVKKRKHSKPGGCILGYKGPL